MPGGRSPMFESLAKLGPVILFAILALVVMALAMNFIQARLHPEVNSAHFDPARHVNQINARGMVDVFLKKSSRQT